MKRRIISLFLALFLLAELPLAVQAAEPIALGDFIITTDEAASSCSFAYNALTISAPGTYTVSMAENIDTTDDRIVVDAEGVTLILDNLHILDECSSLTLNQDAAIRAVGTVTLVTESDGSSVLEPAIKVLTGKTMTFLGGEMTAIGAKGAYGDSDYGKNGIRGNLIMQSGSLTVCGGNGKSGYYRGGDGGHGIYGNVTVNGGTLTATGGSGVNGGGGDGGVGRSGIGGNVTVNGGKVVATGGNGGNSGTYQYPGDGGYGIDGKLTVTGGEVVAVGGKGGFNGYYDYGINGYGVGGAQAQIDHGTVTATGNNYGGDSQAAFEFTPITEPANLTVIRVGTSESDATDSPYIGQRYAQYTVLKFYHITYRNISDTAERPEAIIEGRPTVIPDPVKANHHFDGWLINGSGEPIKELVLAADAYAEPITLTATWTPKTEVTIDSADQLYTYDTQPHSFITQGTPAEGYTVEYYVDGAWTAQAPTDAGNYSVQISRPEDDTYQNYTLSLEHGLIIQKADPQITAPTAKDGLIYSGTPQILIDAGSTIGGKLQYRIEGGEWSEELPTAVEAGQYTVYYRVVGDRNYNDVSEETLTVKILTPEQACPKDDTCPMNPYQDTNLNAWYHDGIHYCLTKGLMEGYSTTVFDPEGATSRAMLVMILWRMEGEPSAADPNFTDVADEAWFAKAIAWAQETGIVNGFPDGTFRPDALLTREQAAVILHRYAAYKDYDTDSTDSLDCFTDGEAVSIYAEDAMNWAIEIGMINGKDHNMLDPQGNTRRNEVATLMMRFCNQFHL